MFKRGVVAVCLFAGASAAYAAGPTEEQVKQALFDRYATAQGSEDLQKALRSEVGVGACQPQGNQYRCLIENKALNTSIPMVFAQDAAGGKWKFVREETQ